MPAGDGIKLNHVISGGVYLGNDTSYARWADFPARDRDPACVLAFSKKRLCRFFDSLWRAHPPTRVGAVVWFFLRGDPAAGGASERDLVAVGGGAW